MICKMNIALQCLIKFNLTIILTKFMHTYGIPCRDILSLDLFCQMALGVKQPEKEQKIQKYQAHSQGWGGTALQ